MSEYAQRIRDLRIDHDKSQSQIAIVLGTTKNQVGKYERGETDLPFEKAILLAQYYNVSLDYLAGLTNVKDSFAKTSSSSSYLISLFQHLSGTNQNRIEERILEMLEQQRKKK